MQLLVEHHIGAGEAAEQKLRRRSRREVEFAASAIRTVASDSTLSSQLNECTRRRL